MNFNIKTIGIVSLVYIGTIFYTFAAYYHLKYKTNWTFAKAFILAIPFVLIEYMFSLHGNHYANTVIGMSAQSILIMTVCFYFCNLWLLNYFVLKHTVNAWREIIAFTLVIMAFLVTTVF